MVDDQVHDEPDAAFARLGDQMVEIRKRPEFGCRVLVIGNVVAIVVHRRLEDRRKPDDVDPERLEVIKLAGDARDIADAVAVAVGKAARVDLVYGRSVPPLALER
jgi:hypothetical protein